MKKLLALILCVMMFVAVIPTAAFAAGTTGGVAAAAGQVVPAFVDKAIAAAAIKDLNDDIKALYTATVANETVFGSAKAIYDFTNGMAKELLKDQESITFHTAAGDVTIYNEDLVSNLRKGLNHIIGDEIRNYMDKRVAAYTNNAGNVQPEKYLNTYVNALNATLASEKAQKNIQELFMEVACMKAQMDANDAADDLYQAIIDWDHWNEFNWGNIALMDPDPNYSTTWLPSATTLVPSGSDAAVADSAFAVAALQGVLNARP